MLSAYYVMRLFQEAGLPDGVINLVYGSRRHDRRRRAASPDLAGIHFTGSTAVFHGMWRTVAGQMENYRNYPRIVGETGGKDFIVAHPSADVDALATAIVRGSFEYQGQKCSAASRVYAPSNLWPALKERLQEEVATIKVGDVSDFGELHGRGDRRVLVPDPGGRDRRGQIDAETDIVVGGGYDDSQGLLRRPDRDRDARPNFRLMREEIFGPV